MPSVSLRCSVCGAEHDPSLDVLVCRACGGVLDIVFPGGLRAPVRRRDLPGVFQWWDSLPLSDVSKIVSLHEGDTPVVPLPRVAAALGLRDLHGKLEGLNPTGSFKDRGEAVLISALREMGAKRVVEDSSGNAGSALAAYGARAGIGVVVFAPQATSLQKVAQIRFHGAEVQLIPGRRDAAADAAHRYCAETGLVSASHNLSPYVAHGMKSFAFELREQLGDRVAHIVFPVGNGSLLQGCALAAREFAASGASSWKPRLHAVQSTTVPVLFEAFHGREWTPPPFVRTVAGGIAVTKPPRAAQVVRAVRESGGRIVAMSEPRIIAWHRRLAREEGVFCEPTSAAAFAGLEQLVQEGHIGKDDAVVVAVTGHGLKDRIPE